MPTIDERLIKTGRLRWRYRDFPLQQHPFSRLAAHSAACADEQGKYWEQHERIYEGQAEWSRRGTRARLPAIRQGNGDGSGNVRPCMKSGKYAGRIQASYEEGAQAGVTSTPTLLVGNRLYRGRIDSDAIRRLVDSLEPLPPVSHDEESTPTGRRGRLSVAAPPRRRRRGRALAGLAFTALGVVYGDIGTSPLYALKECFSGQHGIAPDPRQRARRPLAGLLVAQLHRLASSTSPSSCGPTTAARAASSRCWRWSGRARRPTGRRGGCWCCWACSARRCSTATG